MRSDGKTPIKTKMDGKGTALRDGRARAHATLDRSLFLCDRNMFPTTEASTQNFTCRRNSPFWKTYFCFFLQKKNCVCSLYTATDFIIQFSYMNVPLLLYFYSCLWCLITQFSYMYIAYLVRLMLLACVLSTKSSSSIFLFLVLFCFLNPNLPK